MRSTNDFLAFYFFHVMSQNGYLSIMLIFGGRWARVTVRRLSKGRPRLRIQNLKTGFWQNNPLH